VNCYIICIIALDTLKSERKVWKKKEDAQKKREEKTKKELSMSVEQAGGESLKIRKKDRKDHKELRGITMKRSQRKCGKLYTKIGMINEMPKEMELQCTKLKTRKKI